MKKNIKNKIFKNINWQFLLLLIFLIAIFSIFLENPVGKKETLIKDIDFKSAMFPLVSYDYTDVSVIEANRLFQRNKDSPYFLIIDVSSDYNEGHIANSLGYSIKDGSFETALYDFDKTKIYLIYSRNDADSLNAAKILVDRGFEKVFRLRGNYGSWVEAGFPIEH